MEYVSRVKLDVNGKTITDFKAFTKKAVEHFKEVKLMHKTGFMSMVPRYAVTVDYVVPLTDPEIDWSTVKDGRLTVEYDNGKRTTYTGVYILQEGEEKDDGENETAQTIDLGATGMVKE
jgi:hypothetical protein